MLAKITFEIECKVSVRFESRSDFQSRFDAIFQECFLNSSFGKTIKERFP